MFEEKNKEKKFCELKRNDEFYLIDKTAMEITTFKFFKIEKKEEDAIILKTNRGLFLIKELEFNYKAQILERGIDLDGTTCTKQITTNKKIVDRFILENSKKDQKLIHDKRKELAGAKGRMKTQMVKLLEQLKRLEKEEKKILLTAAVERNYLRMKRF